MGSNEEELRRQKTKKVPEKPAGPNFSVTPKNPGEEGFKPGKIHAGILNIQGEDEVCRQILSDPAKHLRGLGADGSRQEFEGYHPSTAALGFNIGHGFTRSKDNIDVLMVTEARSQPNSSTGVPVKSWVYVDDEENARIITYNKPPGRSLPGQFHDDATYDQLAKFTYDYKAEDRHPFNDLASIGDVGDEWVDMPIIPHRK